ncbi:MAG: DEAD/DEAH box helicase family protein [Thermodesulfobacteriota bacterium]|nr:DEAD/DEAH box helicase family protein [Thermodesulfobacteriota bacterium]
MNTFPIEIKFCKSWRPYQKRVLDELEEHLDDNHLHIIGAPGSGKTVLGLEVMFRLNKPTLIFIDTFRVG